ncbi:MAG: ATP-dependent metallopeptidase FtsH/Yme1/Tma family protein, partial [Patescibacteria group bacterium]
MPSFYKNILWAIITLIIVSSLFSFMLGGVETPQKISLNELAQKINSNEVAEITVSGDDLTVKLGDGTKAISKKETEAGLTETLKNFGVEGPALSKVEVSIESQSGWQFWVGILIPTLIPIFIIGFFFWMMFRQARVGVNQAFNFSRSGVRLSNISKEKITFSDVAGLREAKEELFEIVDFLKNPKK